MLLHFVSHTHFLCVLFLCLTVPAWRPSATNGEPEWVDLSPTAATIGSSHDDDVFPSFPPAPFAEGQLGGLRFAVYLDGVAAGGEGGELSQLELRAVIGSDAAHSGGRRASDASLTVRGSSSGLTGGLRGEALQQHSCQVAASMLVPEHDEALSAVLANACCPLDERSACGFALLPEQRLNVSLASGAISYDAHAAGPSLLDKYDRSVGSSFIKRMKCEETGWLRSALFPVGLEKPRSDVGVLLAQRWKDAVMASEAVGPTDRCGPLALLDLVPQEAVISMVRRGDGWTIRYEASLGLYATAEKPTACQEVDHTAANAMERLFTARIAVQGVSDACTAEVSRRVDGQGFHLDLATRLRIGNSAACTAAAASDKCSLVLLELLPTAVYVEEDQLAEIHRLGGVRAMQLDALNLEAPEHLSDQAAVLVEQPFEADRQLVDLVMPIHLRYHSPSFASPYVSIRIEPPLVFLQCSHELVPGGWKQLRLLVADEQAHQDLRGAVVVQMPVGDLEHDSLVVAGTLGATVAGTLALLYLTWQFSVSQQLHEVKQD